MEADLKNIKRLVILMKKQGVLTLKTKEIELTLSPHAFPVEQNEPLAPQEDRPEQPTYTDQDITLWSAPDYLTKDTN